MKKEYSDGRQKNAYFSRMTDTQRLDVNLAQLYLLT